MALLCPTKPSIYSCRSNLNLKFAFLMIFEIFEYLRLEKKILTTYLKSHLFLHYQQTLQLVLMISTEKNKLEMRWSFDCVGVEYNFWKMFMECGKAVLSNHFDSPLSQKLCCNKAVLPKHAENVRPLIYIQAVQAVGTNQCLGPRHF